MEKFVKSLPRVSVDGGVKSTIKWKYYKALLTQAETNAPVARVLNRDEDDYLGDIVWTRSDVGLYIGSLENGFPNKNLCIFNIQQLSSGLGADEGGFSSKNTVIYSNEHSVFLTTTHKDNGSSDVLLDNFIEIAVRQRGEAPVLLSAETSITGEKVTLIFDKAIVDVGDLATLQSSFVFASGEKSITFLALPTGVGTTTLEFDISGGDVLSYGDDLVIRYDAESIFETIDYGQLAVLEDFIVTNNIPQS